MSLRFKVGEIAILIATHGKGWDDISIPCEVEVIQVGPILAFSEVEPDTLAAADSDYRIRLPDGSTGLVLDKHLRKRPQPGIPESVRSWFEVKQGEPA